MRALLVTFAIAACHSAGSPGDFVPFVDASPFDAAPDAPCGYGYPRYAITTTGSTPAGSLADYHYASVGYDCNWYTVVLSATAGGEGCSADRWMYIQIDDPQEPTQPTAGTFGAGASEFTSPRGPEAIDFAQLTFDATVIDRPSRTDQMHLVGHLVANASNWSFDLPIDMYAPAGIGSCTL
jgi:hypothetical protein